MSVTEDKMPLQVADNDQSEQLRLQIEQALGHKQAVSIHGGGSKEFIGTPSAATPLDVSKHSGIVSYEPTELVITARCGTTLDSLNATLAASGQMLPFEPPAFSPEATLGGTVACAISGPARPYNGAVRDYVLGCRIINGHAQELRFGGEVMKNVAGYDITRLMTGAMGTLGLLLDTSFKVLPMPEHEITLVHESTASKAIEDMQALAGMSQPVTASAFIDGRMYTRLSGALSAVTASAKTLGGDIETASDLWSNLRDQKHAFFLNDSDVPLWRLSVPALTPELPVNGNCLYDWAGMQRWLYSSDYPQSIRNVVQNAGGHAQLYRADESLKREVGAFHPLSKPIMQLHRNIKHEFDPHAIFNPQRMYPEL